MMKQFRRTLGSLAVPASLFILVGCGSTAAPDGTGQTSAAQQTTAPAPQKPTLRAHTPHGPAAMMLRSALADLELDAAQKTKIEGIIKQLEPVQGKSRAAFSHALAQAVRSGKVDPASFTAEYAAIDKQVEDRVAAQANALDQLHSTLDRADRGLLVDQLQAKLDNSPRFFHRGMARHRHWMRRSAPGAQQPTQQGAAQEPMHRGLRRNGPPRMGGFFAHKLGLTQSQVAQLREQAPAFDGAKKGECEQHMNARRDQQKKMLEAFVGDDFKAGNFIDANAIAQRVQSHARKRVEHLARLVAILTPEQQSQLAGMLDRRAGAKP